MADNVTLHVNIEILPFGTARSTERVYLDVPAEPERETITASTTTAVCEAIGSELPYILR